MGKIQYSMPYFDDIYAYREVVLPTEVAKRLPKDRLLSENEWRAIEVKQSREWVHYAIHRPEPHILLFRRPMKYDKVHLPVAAGESSSANGAKELGTPNEEMWPGVSKLENWHEFPQWTPLPVSRLVHGYDLDENGVHLLSEMLQYEPSNRISANKAMEHPYFDDLDNKTYL